MSEITTAYDDLEPCPRCGAHKWWQNGELLMRDIVCCSECNRHVMRRDVARETVGERA